MTKYIRHYQGVLEPLMLLRVLIRVKHGLLGQRDPKERNSEKPSDASITLIFRKSGPKWSWVNRTKRLQKGKERNLGFPVSPVRPTTRPAHQGQCTGAQKGSEMSTRVPSWPDGLRRHLGNTKRRTLFHLMLQMPPSFHFLRLIFSLPPPATSPLFPVPLRGSLAPSPAAKTTPKPQQGWKERPFCIKHEGPKHN